MQYNQVLAVHRRSALTTNVTDCIPLGTMPVPTTLSLPIVYYCVPCKAKQITAQILVHTVQETPLCTDTCTPMIDLSSAIAQSETDLALIVSGVIVFILFMAVVGVAVVILCIRRSRRRREEDERHLVEGTGCLGH